MQNMYKQTNERVNIVLGSSREYAKYIPVMLYSLFENNHYSFWVYLYYHEEMDDSINRIQGIVNKFGNRLVLCKVEESEIKKLDDGELWHASTWYRWRCMEDLYTECDRVMMMGVDMIITGDIGPLYFDDFEGKAIIATRDAINLLTYDGIFDECIRFGKTKESYFNCECSVIDMKAVHDTITLNKMLDFYKQNDFLCIDQGALNYGFGEYIKVYDTYKYNLAINIIGRVYSVEVAEKMCKESVVLHFIGNKPWKDYDNSYAHKLWLEYAKKANMFVDIATDIIENCIPRLRSRINQLDMNVDTWEQLCDGILNEEIWNRFVSSRLCIYGGGRLGRYITKMMLEKKCKIYCIVDKCRHEEIMGIPCCTPEEYNEKYKEKESTMLVTVLYDKQSIKQSISNNVKLYFIDEILKK